MGVPGFFLWLWKKYKSNGFVFNMLSIPDKDIDIISNIDYFLLDMNCMIHPICFKTLAEFEDKKIDNDKLENKMIENVISYLEKMINIVKPKIGIYIAIDGVAPVAKMKQQRLRRYKSINDKIVFDNIKRKHNKKKSHDWSNSAITPGTLFMSKITSSITLWAKEYSLKYNKKIIFSPSNVVGEGEHKLLQYIYNNSNKFNYVVYGLDADLIFLMLATGLDNIYLMRESIENNKDIISFVSIKTMKECIIDTFNKIIQKNEFEIKYDSKRFIDDFIFICYLMGNDFLPHMPALDIYDNAIDLLLNKYIEMFNNNLNYIVDKGNLNSEMVYNYLKILSLTEEETIINNYDKKKYYPQCLSQDPYDIEMHRIDNMMFKVNDPIMLGLGKISEWKTRFYNHYYHTTTDEDIFSNKMAYHYLIGLKWVALYYFDKCPAWDWYYPYDHAPFLTDIIKDKNNFNIVFNVMKFNEGKSLSPFEQLLTVLPKQSAYLLPEELRIIMTNTKGSCTHLYPDKFQLDMIGKKKYWMCSPILPNLEINLIRKIFEKYSQKLSSDKRIMNNIGDNILF